MGQFQNQSQQQFRDAEQAKQFAKEHEGEVKVNIPKKGKTNSSANDAIDGEYVDYEEVE
jgi:hypothetical protein